MTATSLSCATADRDALPRVGDRSNGETTRSEPSQLVWATHPGRLAAAWWPASRDATVELPRLVRLTSTHLDGPVARLALNIEAWDGIRPPRLRIDGHVVRVGWFHTLPPSLVAVGCDPFEMVDLVVIPPEWGPERAHTALARLARRDVWGSDPDVLLASLGGTSISPSRL